MGHRAAAALVLCLLVLPLLCRAESEIIAPVRPVTAYTQRVLDTARGELGYTEGPHGYSKYGEWSGDPYAQWCAEFLCWCVDQADQQYGTQLLNTRWPNYSGSNTGRSWFIRHGRYIVRTGYLENWGVQWLNDSRESITAGSYIPQPGDWVFFTWDDDEDTDHVAMVEFCTREADGSVLVHVIEGNAPAAVQRRAYPLNYNRILGYGTVHDMADVTMRAGCSGEKVRQLQEKLCRLGYLPGERANGSYGGGTAEAVRRFQRAHRLHPSGLADKAMQLLLEDEYRTSMRADPSLWRVEDHE